MAFATPQDVRDYTVIDELSDMDDTQLNRWISRSDMTLQIRTNKTFEDEENVSTLEKLKLATIMLVEYLYLNSDVDVLETRSTNIQSEGIGSYNYSKGSNDMLQDWMTGIPELDLILKNLRGNVSKPVFFRTNKQPRCQGAGGIREL